ncbi:MAG: 4Fe-4S dicluster domain-containing protein [Rhodobacter sp.]|nr:4Fe-4S dicluster domain-containing protein [Rhodobacter sp.]
MQAAPGDSFVISSPAPLIGALVGAGWRVIGPQEVDGTIAYEELRTADDLPRGRTDDQEAGHYRLTEGRPEAWFDYVVGPQSWKKWLYPSRRKLWSATKTADGFEIDDRAEDYPKTAFFGVRPCEIAAIERQDAVFDNGSFTDTDYARRRAATLIVAVQCARSAATCFCASMNTGPHAEEGFDLALTELDPDGDHRFLLQIGSAQGAALADGLPLRDATGDDHATARLAAAHAAAQQTRRLPADIAPRLKGKEDHPGWQAVAEKCLHCANCTLACPTCFCSDVEDTNDLTGDHTERWRVWDSCFSLDFSYIHGGAVRQDPAARYRQWLTHKLSSWHDQFGSSGCVGCGRCIAWCPVGIDITEEAAVIARDDG